MRLSALAALAFGGALALATTVGAETVKYKVDDEAIKASLTGKAGDPANGKKVFLNRKKGNCLACHVVSSLKDQPFHGEVGPPLDGTASRWSEGELRLRIVNPKLLNEDTIMPSFYKTDGFHRVLKKFKGKSVISAQEVEDVLAYIMTFKDSE
ncbi:MAG: sulfur oxidation c-type cytochrome SoxX [Pseudomonadota bacterium]